MRMSNTSRLCALMARAQAGEELTLGFFGGSITQGSLSSTGETCYAYLVYQWWVKAFPRAKFHYVNGGIGGTSSHFGVARAVQDLLQYQPDFVVVDFSVNDDPTNFFQETYEGLIRKILTWTSEPAVLILNNVFYDTGASAQDLHNAVARHYGIPFASIRDTVYKRLKAGEWNREDISPDGLHPNDKGHALVAGELCAVLEQFKEAESTLGNWAVPAPLTVNAYESAHLRTTLDTVPVLSGFRADSEEKHGHLDTFKNGWIGKSLGDSITFEVEASCIAVQYRRSVHRPAPMARVTVDGGAVVTLDGSFDEDWGDALRIETLLHHGTPGRHTVEVKIVQAGEAAGAPFYLLALLTD